MKIAATIEARMTSSRLPGKVLVPVLGKPMLGRLIERLQSVPLLSEIVLATTTNPNDDVLEEFARNEGVALFRGSENDVMTRVIGAAESVGADVVVEITGDCPIIDPDIVSQTIQMFLSNPKANYVSNAHIRSYPDGMDVQVFSLNTLKKSAILTSDPLDHEHVTLHIRNHPELFPAVHLVAPPSLFWPELGLTLDEQADFVLLEKIINKLEPQNPLFGCREVIQLLIDNPQWVAINNGVTRKGDS
jgi:spore coat polysaccharide biosynthesis protein SpsF